MPVSERGYIVLNFVPLFQGLSYVSSARWVGKHIARRSDALPKRIRLRSVASCDNFVQYKMLSVFVLLKISHRKRCKNEAKFRGVCPFPERTKLVVPFNLHQTAENTAQIISEQQQQRSIF